MSDTCCPPQAPKVNVDVNYTPKGTYETVGDLKTYLIGPQDAQSGVFVVYDIFGYYPQTLQGSDILSSQLNSIVAMPDFFEGEPCDINIFPPDNEEKKQKFGVFWSTKADFDKNQKAIKKSIEALKAKFPGVKKWAIIGYYWGGKMATLASAEGTPFAASVQIHPAVVDPANATALANAHFTYASGDEPKDAVAKFEENLRSHSNPTVRENSQVITREDLYHGWMAARAKFGEEKYLKAYQEGYEKVAEFLRKNL